MGGLEYNAMSDEPKITEGWTLIGINGYPVLDAATPQPEDARREQECVVMWKHDYEQIQKQLARLEKLEDYMSHMPFDIDDMIGDEEEEDEGDE